MISMPRRRKTPGLHGRCGGKGFAMDINWYPGHMSKTRRLLAEDVRRVDAVCELLDARIPLSSRNPDIDEIAGDKPRLVLLNRADQADPAVTALWRGYFTPSIEISAHQPGGVRAVAPAVRALLSDTLAKYAEKGQTGRSLKIMVVGIPNVGKSTLINSLTGRRTLKAEDRPGVTRATQWARVTQAAGPAIDMLDTPGILWPRLGDRRTGLHLAVTGAIRGEILDTAGIAAELMETLKDLYPQNLAARYKIGLEGSGLDLLVAAARKRGFLISGGEPDVERMALTLVSEFRGGKLGRISLEKPPCQ
jgi:ribosome biogenesis GTPase A